MQRTRFGPSGRLQEIFTLADGPNAQPRTLFIDQATLVPSSDQNGSAIAPYATLTQAAAHIQARPSVIAWQLRVAFGDYSSEAPLFGVTASPPASLNPAISGGLITPAGASNVTAIVRLATT